MFDSNRVQMQKRIKNILIFNLIKLIIINIWIVVFFSNFKKINVYYIFFIIFIIKTLNNNNRKDDIYNIY